MICVAPSSRLVSCAALANLEVRTLSPLVRVPSALRARHARQRERHVVCDGGVVAAREVEAVVAACDSVGGVVRRRAHCMQRAAIRGAGAGWAEGYELPCARITCK